jgi:hypothetical protein
MASEGKDEKKPGGLMRYNEYCNTFYRCNCCGNCSSDRVPHLNYWRCIKCRDVVCSHCCSGVKWETWLKDTAIVVCQNCREVF